MSTTLPFTAADRWRPPTLGTLAMLGSPLLVLSLVFPATGASRVQGTLAGLLGLFYLLGWGCALVALRRLGVMGDGAGARRVWAVQAALLAGALAFSVEETLAGGFARAPFPLLDVCWPLAHTFLLVTGTVVARAGVWRGWRRWAVLAPGFKIPLLVVLVAAGLPAPMNAGGRGVAGTIQVIYAACAFVALGWAVRTAETRAAAR